MKSKSKTSPAPPTNKPTLVAFLLDRTGSMSQCRDETIKGFNGYIDELERQGLGATTRFTLTQFDSIAIDIVHDAVPLSKVARLSVKTYQPRASTPLFDAIGKTVRATEQRAGDKYKVLFVTLTDGLENASSYWKLEIIRELIKEKEDKNHWTFAHIGVGEHGWSATREYAMGTQSCSNLMMADPGDEKRTYRRMAGATIRYAANAGTCGQSVNNIWAGTDEPKPK